MQAKRKFDSDNESPSPAKSQKTPSQYSKWTPEALTVLCDLKENNVPWETIAMSFPGRSLKTIKNTWTAKRKMVTETFTPEKDTELKCVLEKFEKKKWDLIGKEIGMSGEGCKRRAMELGVNTK